MIILLYLYFLVAAVFVGIFLLASFVFLKKSYQTARAYEAVVLFSVIIGVIFFVSLVALLGQDWSMPVNIGGIL